MGDCLRCHFVLLATRATGYATIADPCFLVRCGYLLSRVAPAAEGAGLAEGGQGSNHVG